MVRETVRNTQQREDRNKSTDRYAKPHISDWKCKLRAKDNILEPENPAPSRSLAHDAPENWTQNEGDDNSKAILRDGISILGWWV